MKITRRDAQKVDGKINFFPDLIQKAGAKMMNFSNELQKWS